MAIARRPAPSFFVVIGIDQAYKGNLSYTYRPLMVVVRRGLAVLAVAFATAAVPAPAGAQPLCARPVALVESIKNSVQLVPISTKLAVPATRRVTICAGDVVRVGDNSRAVVLILSSNTPLAIDQNSEFVLTESPARAGTFIDLLRGALLFISRVRQAVEIRTPFLNAAIEGTELVIRVGADRTVVTVLEGTVRASNPFGAVLVGAGQQAVALQGQPPQLMLIVRPRDAVQWALYYEPVLPVDSFEQLALIPPPAQDASFFVRRASLLLGAGQLEEARADLGRAQALDPNNGDVYTLETIINVALDDRPAALASGRMAVARTPKSPPAALALSYALQADFQLEAAQEVVEQAVAIAPDDAESWARLAELRLMRDDLRGAAAAAERAVALSPQSPRAHTVIGFVALAQANVARAAAGFETAGGLEPDNPTARLGGALAAIRRGRLAEGRGQLEVAVALDPGDPLLRSYLGKAYADEKRDPAAVTELAQAKTLDARDPTPWFYDAIRKQTLNRPVEALQDVQQAIELNDNRAVYRSRLLLDQDLAARSAGLGRIYRDLGFEQLALVEAWTSVSASSRDYSGHRFLADVYSALPRHEIARVSELLQSQLLQPINISPVQPQLAETNLSILEGSGPAEPAFSEFNPLFNRNRLSLLVSGAAGGNDTFGDEVVVSGVWNKLSFSAGQYHFASDGFRENNAQEQDIFNVFVQGTLTSSTSLQGEVRSTDNRRGDLRLAAQFRPLRTQRTDFESARLGFRQVLSPRSDFIASVMYGRVDDRFDDKIVELGFPGTPGSLGISADRRAWITEIQHLYSFPRLRVISGLGHYRADRDETVRLEIRIPVPPFSIPRTTLQAEEITHTNAYVYSHIDALSAVTVTLGASGDFHDSGILLTDQFNPKAGVSWQPTRTTTFRAAGFRTMRRALVSHQTIEPTHVSGFNQLFDAVEGERGWRYGLGVDQKLFQTVFAGAEVSWRDLKHPSISVARGLVTDPWRERFRRAYIYSTPHPRLGLSLEYMFEKFEREGTFGEEQIVTLATHRVPMGVAYFHPSGFLARVTTTAVNQKGIFGTTDLPRPGEDTFAVVDVSAGYRLPRRYGLVTLDVKNLLDQQFQFQDTDPKSPRIIPSRLAVLRFTVTM